MSNWEATLEQVKKEEAEQGYNDESSDNDSVTEETKEEREERLRTYSAQAASRISGKDLTRSAKGGDLNDQTTNAHTSS